MEKMSLAKAIIIAMLIYLSQLLLAGDDDLESLSRNVAKLVYTLNATNKEINGNFKNIGPEINSASDGITRQMQQSSESLKSILSYEHIVPLACVATIVIYVTFYILEEVRKKIYKKKILTGY